MDKDIEFPKRGELVVATVKEIVGHGAYLIIGDYNIKGYLPITEVSSKWIRSIDEVLKPGQKIVVKVLRIDRFTNSVDVSLKEVSDKEKDRILRIWKRNKRGEQILNELLKTFSENERREIETKLENLIERENTVYDALERILREPEILNKIGLVNYRNKIINFLSKKIRLKKYVYEATLKVMYVGKGGVYKVRDALLLIKNELSKEISKGGLAIYHDGAPKYRLKVWSYRPEIIKRRVIPSIKNAIDTLAKNLDIEILKEELKVET